MTAVLGPRISRMTILVGSSYRILRATVLAGLAALFLSTHVFVAVDLVRAKVLEARHSCNRRAEYARTFSHVNGLEPPFALIARINSQSAGTSSFSIALDGMPVCERDVAGGGSRRVDCAVAGEWNPTIEHQVAIQGPSTAWTLEYLELATHHGNTSGAHYLLVLPASSGPLRASGARLGDRNLVDAHSRHSALARGAFIATLGPAGCTSLSLESSCWNWRSARPRSGSRTTASCSPQARSRDG